jgi:hypothetical protein
LYANIQRNDFCFFLFSSDPCADVIFHVIYHLLNSVRSDFTPKESLWTRSRVHKSSGRGPCLTVFTIFKSIYQKTARLEFNIFKPKSKVVFWSLYSIYRFYYNIFVILRCSNIRVKRRNMKNDFFLKSFPNHETIFFENC